MASSSSLVKSIHPMGQRHSVPPTSPDGTLASVLPLSPAPVTAAAPSASLTTAKGDHVTISGATVGTVTVGSDTFSMHGAGGAGVALGGGGEMVQFIGMSQLSLTGSDTAGVRDVITADTGTNTFVAGAGALKVAGGSGADTFIFKPGSGSLKIANFSAAQGDRLVIAASLRNSMTTTADGAGGTLISFLGAGSIDLKSIATLPSAAISFVVFDPLPPGLTSSPPATPAPSVSLTTAKGDHVSISGATVGTVAVGTDIVSMHGNGGAGVALGSAGETLQFVGMSQLSVTGSNAAGAKDVVTADAGTNAFVASAGAMEISGGSGADTYIFSAGSGSLTIDDFSASKGDRLMIGANLRGSMTTSADGAGGTLISFSGAGSIDLKSVAALPSAAIGFVAIDPLPPFLR